jgi:hypothetical protein
MAVDKAALDAAIHAALKGPEKKKIKVARHEWNVKKIDITRDGGVLVVDGRSGHHISHHRAWVPDDQIYFGFAIGQDGSSSVTRSTSSAPKVASRSSRTRSRT